METSRMRKIMIASPVYQKPKILEAFLSSLKEMRYKNASLDYIFVNDNVDEESHTMLENFHRDGSTTIILPGSRIKTYVCDKESHHWDDSLMLKVANYKNSIIQYVLKHEYDELFFVDSDLCLHPDLIMHLERRQKEIVSEIFWTKWHEGLPLEPNTWLFDEYDLVPKHLGETLSDTEQKLRQDGFIAKLKKPGLYEVGGLGACTLIRRSALLKGVNFAPISNLTIHGEDRFFCIRAAVLGIQLYVDTSYPAYHIYREPDLAGVGAYMQHCQEQPIPNRITLSMVVHNETGHYLERMLKSLAGHVDAAVIIDDASTDDTVLMCRKILSDIPLTIISNQQSMFADEVSLRKKQWAETIKTNPDWILNLDADEMIEDNAWTKMQESLDDPHCERCTFHLYDMWNETQYREDDLWNAHNSSRTFLLRYRPDFDYQWRETPQHCGRFPMNCEESSSALSEYRIQHFGWATVENRERKYKRYQQLDPGAVYGIKEQYESILDASPHLLTWSIS